MRHCARTPSRAALPGAVPAAPDAPARRRALGAFARAGLAAAGGLSTSTAGLSGWLLSTSARAAATPARRPTAAESMLRTSGLPLSSLGAFVQPVDDGDAVVAVNAETSYAMASTTKVVTSLAALDLLGVNFRWRTFAFLRGVLEDGRLRGDLLVVGGGDARLTTADLREWFSRLRAQGLRRIDGDIVVDRFAFALNESDHADTPPPTAGRAHHVRPDALAIDEGLLHVAVTPSHGAFATVTVDPPLAGVPLANRVGMRGGCSAWASLNDGGRDKDPARGAAPTLTVLGSWGAGCGRRELTLVPRSPASLTTHAFAGLWLEAGGTLTGRVVERTRTVGDSLLPTGPDGQPQLPWSVHVSDPLPAVLQEMNKTSDNVTARHLMLALARGFPVRPATLPEAQARMRDWLRRQGLAEGDVEVENGSGLSRGERARPRALARLLVNAWHAPRRREFVASLPVAGVDGTLEHRMQYGAATGRAFLKTGTLLDTRALAGYVTGASGRTYALAMMVNHPDAARALPTLDRFVEWLARTG
jgi:D-alanyl-D-alanine carboxypeptidase/D-alanyl-D-alanine-endopeptidase (penicillin-binding protein 4)